MIEELKSKKSKLFCAPTRTWTLDLLHRTSTFNTDYQITKYNHDSPPLLIQLMEAIRGQESMATYVIEDTDLYKASETSSSHWVHYSDFRNFEKHETVLAYFFKDQIRTPRLRGRTSKGPLPSCSRTRTWTRGQWSFRRLEKVIKEALFEVINEDIFHGTAALWLPLMNYLWDNTVGNASYYSFFPR